MEHQVNLARLRRRPLRLPVMLPVYWPCSFSTPAQLFEGSGGFRSTDDQGVDVLGECTAPAWGWEPFPAVSPYSDSSRRPSTL